MKIKILSVLLIAMISSCLKEDTYRVEYFAFGTAYGECTGDCAKFFLIMDGKIYPDISATYEGRVVFGDSALPDDKYLFAKPLITNFPSYLLFFPDSTFGCPDCHDQGGIHIEMMNNNDIVNWHIDMDIDKQPEEIRQYLSVMLAVLADL